MSAAGLVIVGSGPGGLAAARAFRKADSDTPVTMVTADPHPPYNRPPLTKDYLRGESSMNELWLEDPGWYAEHDVDLRLGTVVEHLDFGGQVVGLADGGRLAYRDLVLATGSRPKHLPVPGGEHPELIYVRDRDSGERLRGLAEGRRGRVAVIGSGFIGCEVAASLASRGTEVLLITEEPVPHARRLGPEAGERIGGWLRDAGVELLLDSGVSALERRGSTWRIEVDGGATLAADAVVCGGGATPNVELGRDAGLVEESGGLVTDASLRSSAPQVFAVGDIAYALNSAARRRLRVEHWGDAESHGEIAGAVAAGVDLARERDGGPRRSSPFLVPTWNSAPGFWSGLGERTLKYSAWQTTHDDRVLVGGDESWAVWYRSGSRLAGVLTYNNDRAYERGQQLLERNATFAEAVG